MRLRRGIPALALALVAPLAACSDDDAPGADRARTAPGEPPSVRSGEPATSGLLAVLARAVADGPSRARSPRGVAAQIEAAETAIADPSTPPRVLGAAGHLQQLAFRVLAEHPRWEQPVLDLLPRRHHFSVRANLASRLEFRSMHTSLADTLPAWRIVRPAPADELLGHYREAQRTFGVGWEYLAAINLIETGMGRIRGTSVADARGPMQFIPETWAAYGRGDIDDPRDAIMAAARYLDARGFSRPGGVPDALYSYNNHPAYVRGITRIAETLQRDPRAFAGYYHWQVYYHGTEGDVLLPVGYDESRPVPVRQYLRSHPQQ